MEKILTKHFAGKKGWNIEKKKYDIVRKAIIACLKGKELTYTDLVKCVKKRIPDFEGSFPWYVEVVKLDLEARKIIKRTNMTPQIYRLVK